MSDDLASLFGPPPEPPSQDVRFRQGLIVTFDEDTLENTVNVGGTVLTNLTLLGVGEVRLLIPGAVVGILAVGTSTKTMFITGRILIPDTPEAASAVVPGSPGQVSSFAGSGAAPFGWLICNGAAVSRTTYADLFVAIGTLWGAGDGSTTFNLPDLRDRVFMGAGATWSVGATGGAVDHSHTNPSTGSTGDHAHTNPSTDAVGSHSHSIAQGTDVTSGVGGTFVFTVSHQTHSHGGSTGSAGGHSHTQGNTGTTGAHGHSVGNTGTTNNLPPFAALTPIIRY